MKDQNLQIQRFANWKNKMKSTRTIRMTEQNSKYLKKIVTKKQQLNRAD